MLPAPEASQARLNPFCIWATWQVLQLTFSLPLLSAFKRWSNTSTWKGHPRPPQAGDNVQIFCGESILLDVPDVKLGLLEIYGHLAFLDDASLPNISLSADSVFVFGNLSIGSADKPFRSDPAAISYISNWIHRLLTADSEGCCAVSTLL